ncbi:2-octaprenyl-6-methoxyphenyl hydroxylase [Shewanella salipaludis]|uniref:2-octaprenyl-6-methoxyphenyl hydroxylase n=1 Tax=Shewanella salipaludis TaxID=2723052 RepID=A0A972G1H5_9GAMM|nr:2-octaprenyl-6-methoxyphenyl hydroxylase [Shewanella salipaludis]NMH65459.1 2-octaprenyl-6-methoxyphenyl hydroxylase [Shewanella salipaludis]
MSASIQTETQVAEVDIAIVGGAMTGATLALGLARLAAKGRPLSIALIEAQAPGEAHPGFDARSIAIAQGSIFELRRLGLWPLLAELGTKISNIHISDRGHLGMTELNASQFHLDALGQVVELERVGRVLFDALRHSRVQLHCPAKLTGVAPEADGHLLTLDNQQRLRARLVVAADGIHSPVRQSLGQPLTQIDFGQTALVANIITDKPHESWAFERFTATGPLALLPMGDSQGQARLSLVWALEAGQAAMLKSAPKAEFLQALQQAFGYRAGRFVDVGSRHSYPLCLSYMPRPIFHRCVFIGNAAQTLHPIAGQGFNLGLRDLVCLLEVLEEALARGQDIGAAATLHSYLALRETDRRETITNIEFLVRGFSNQHWPLVAGRSLGLRLLSWFPPLKLPVARKAMGWR